MSNKNLDEIESKEDFEDVLEILDRFEIVSAGGINCVLEEAGIPPDVYWSVAAKMRNVVIPKILAQTEALINNDFSGVEEPEGRPVSQILLIGWPAKKTIDITTSCSEEVDESRLSPQTRIFCESLQQQLSKRCGEKRIEIVCPFSHREQCCGLEEALRRLHERLPEEDRKQFKRPNCALAR